MGVSDSDSALVEIPSSLSVWWRSQSETGLVFQDRTWSDHISELVVVRL